MKKRGRKKPKNRNRRGVPLNLTPEERARRAAAAPPNMHTPEANAKRIKSRRTNYVYMVAGRKRTYRSQAQLARAYGVTPGAVSKWLAKGVVIRYVRPYSGIYVLPDFE